MPQSRSSFRSSLTSHWPLLGFMYLAWGGTYLGVKFALVDLPVFLMSGGRFFLAGALLLFGVAFFDWAHFHRGTLREWRDASAIGLLLLVFGIGTGNWAQQFVDSSFAAMAFSALPLWIVTIDWLRPGGQAPGRRVMLGLLCGFIGIGIILAPLGRGHATGSHLGLNLLLVVASLCWASGAVFSRQVVARGSALLPVGRQMVVAGVTLLLIGLCGGDATRLHLAEVHAPAWLGFLYLVTIGSLGGYPVYIYLMRVCPAGKVATIPYINLLVAIFLGWSLGRETITARLLAGTALVLVSVAVVLRAKGPQAIAPGD